MHLFHVFLHIPSKKEQAQAFSARFCLRQLYQKPQHPEILQLQHYADGEFLRDLSHELLLKMDRLQEHVFLWKGQHLRDGNLRFRYIGTHHILHPWLPKNYIQVLALDKLFRNHSAQSRKSFL